MDVIIVDKDDRVICNEEKIKAHKEGKLHRAFSIFIFNSKKELLLQKRSLKKYHSGGKWSNTCCSHPLDGKDIKEQAEERLKKEMGISTELKGIFSFVYKTKVDNNLTEHEYDHVFLGYYDKDPEPDEKEVENWKWMKIQELKQDIKQNPDAYTPWLKLCLDKVIEKLN